IKASFLVAGLTGQLGLPEFDDLNRTFVSAPFQWNQIRKFAGEVFVYHATNDPYVPIEQAYEIGKGLGVQVKEIQNGGHLNAEFGYTQFEELLCDIDSLAL
ncbi:MAG: alpha/beta hydrolase, partial [Bdellovibrionales bacterium]|nr:alpha/beta hydrolase [Bdellovibrionales bacterium]